MTLDPLTCTAAELLLAAGWVRHEVDHLLPWKHPARSGWMSTDLALVLEFETRERERRACWDPLSRRTRQERTTKEALGEDMAEKVAASHAPTPIPDHLF